MYRSPTFKLVVAALVLATVVTGYSLIHKEVTVVEGSSRKAVSTFAGNVGNLLKQEGIKLGPSDAVKPGLDAALEEGCTVEIFRGFTVTITADGKKQTTETIEKKVKDILQAVGITVEKQDIVQPGLDTVVKGETEIKVQRVTWKEVVEEKKIPFQTIRRKDNTLNKGATQVIEPGKEGIEENRYRITFVDGNEMERELLESSVTKKPEPRVIAEGTVQLASRGGNTFSFHRELTVTATAYTHTGRNTATGKKPVKGTVSVDPRVIPLGSRLYIDGYGYGVAQDIGSSIVGNRIDVFLETEAAARKWGRKTVKLYILK